MRNPVTIYVDVDFELDNQDEDGCIDHNDVKNAVWDNIDESLTDNIVDSISDATGFCINAISFSLAKE